MALSATLTASTYSTNPRAHHVGINYAQGHIEKTGTLSDIIILARIPNKATIVDVKVWGAGGGTNAVLKIGCTKGDAVADGNRQVSTAADNCLITSLDLATGAGASSGTFVGYRISISDTDAQAGADVYATVVSGTWSITASFDFLIGYVMDGNV